MQVRYDFWSLVTALDSGLKHGGTSPNERAKAFVDGLEKMEKEVRHERERRISSVTEYLAAIQREMASRRNTPADTVTFDSIKGQ